MFSGSGSFGLEAISRGANKCHFIENYSNALEILSKNVKHLKCEDCCKITNLDSFDFVENLQSKELETDIIFLDPPFKKKK